MTRQFDIYTRPPKSMDELPDVVHSFQFRADLAEILIPGDDDDQSSNLRPLQHGESA